MSSIVVAGDTSGSVTLSAPAVAGASVLTLPVATDTLVGKATTDTLTNKTLGSGLVAGASILTSGTAQASTSGTSIDFTGIPSWVKRITVMFSGVSTSGTSIMQIQIGAGAVETTGYLGSYDTFTSTPSANLITTGFGLALPAASSASNGIANIILLTGSTWAYTSFLGGSDTGRISYGGSSKTIAGTLDRIRITSVNGTDTFDAGSINIMYE